MVQAADPGQRALQTQPEAGVWDRAVAAQVAVPLQGLRLDAFLAYLAVENLEALFAHAAPDDFPVALRRQHIHVEHDARVLGVLLHVERLDTGRVALDHQRALEGLRQHGLLVRPEVLPVFDLDTFRCEALDRVAVADAWERALDTLECAEIAFQQLEFAAAVLERALHAGADQTFGQFDIAVVVLKSHLRLDHPELHQVAPGLGLLGPEGRTKGVHLAERHCARLGIELSALGQVGGLVEVLGLEQRRCPFARGGRQDGRVETHEPELVKVVVDRLLNLGTNTQHCVGPARAQPQVAVFQEEGHAVLFRRDRVVDGVGNRLEGVDMNLDPELGARILGDRPADPQGAFLREFASGLEGGARHVVAPHHALHDGAAVA